MENNRYPWANIVNIADMKKFFLYALALGFFSACSGGGVFSDLKGDRASELSGRVPEGGSGEQGQAGVVTAGEWNDLDHWPFL